MTRTSTTALKRPPGASQLAATAPRVSIDMAPLDGTPTDAAASSAVVHAGSRWQSAPVVFWSGADGKPAGGHDRRAKAAVTRALAALLGCPFEGEHDEREHPSGRATAGTSPRRYLVPAETLDAATARRLGVRHVGDLFGGVVPHPFVGTKLISHPLPPGARLAPAGWSAAHGERIRHAVLPGYSAFCIDDARLAGELLLQGGAVRIKDPDGVGGLGQSVVTDGAALQAHLASLDAQALAMHGVVLERNLSGVTTRSVGEVIVGPWVASYVGTQSLTLNHRGEEVYGGSTLHVVRGDLAALLAAQPAGAGRTAVEQALVYHRAAMASFDGLLASRCNYDIAQGTDDSGAECSGVLEQSWRIGGASGAEIAALHAFRADPALHGVQASTHEVYDADHGLPADAWVLYDGIDPDVGRLLKYVRVHPETGPGGGDVGGDAGTIRAAATMAGSAA